MLKINSAHRDLYIQFYGSSKICPARETVLNQKCIGCEMYKFSCTYRSKIIFFNLTSAAYKKQPTATVSSPKVALLHVLEAQLRNNKIEENPGPAHHRHFVNSSVSNSRLLLLRSMTDKTTTPCYKIPQSP